MKLITASGLDGLGAYSVTASHNPGEIAPTFTVSCLPPSGNQLAFSEHFAWQPPEAVTFTIGSVSWDCVPGDAPRTVSGGAGVEYSVTYIPDILYTLRYAQYKKSVAWISCPKWQFDLYLNAYDEEEYEVFHKEADVYASNGFTVKDILEKLGELMDIEITVNMPPLHVDRATVMLSKDEMVLSFIQSLLPSGFQYSWDWQPEHLTIGLAERATIAITLPPKAYAVSIDDPAVVQYDRVVLTGAPYKIQSGLTLGETPYDVKKRNPRFLKISEETFPPETDTLNGQEIQRTITRRTQLGPDGTPFAVLEENQVVVGAIYGYNGFYNSTGVIQRITTTYEYENDDPLIYLKPRLTKTTTVSSGYVTCLDGTEIGASNGILYHYTTNGEVLSREDFLAKTDRGSVLASSYGGWVDDYETVEETIDYITAPDEPTPEWPEGYERLHKNTVTHHAFFAGNRYYSCMERGRDCLDQIARYYSDKEEEPLIVMVITEKQTFESNIRETKLTTPGAFSFQDTQVAYSPEENRFQVRQQQTSVNSTPPACPSEYLVEPLKVTIGKPESGVNLVYAASAQIPTSNPLDFEVWGAKLYYDLTHRQRALTVSVPDYIFPQGYRIGGGTVVGWAAQQQGAVASAQLTII
jgi:hypothetical protein